MTIIVSGRGNNAPSFMVVVALATLTGGVCAATAAARQNSIFCLRGKDVLELTPTIEISSDPASTRSRATATERLIVTLPSGGQLDVNHDDRYLSVVLAGDQPSINIIDVTSGQVREVCKIRPPLQRHSHLQWRHTGLKLPSIAPGDDWRREGSPERISMVDPAERVLRSVYQQIEGELVTRESWWVNDQILFCGAPPAVDFGGAPPKREWSHVKALDARTGVVRIIGAGSCWPKGTDAGIWKRSWWHCAGSTDGRVVADTFYGDLVLLEGTTTRPRLLSSDHRTFATGERPQPGWDRSGKTRTRRHQGARGSHR